MHCEYILSRIEANDTIYANYAAGPSFLWYRERPEYVPLLGLPVIWGTVVRDGDWTAADDFDRIRDAGRCWLLFSHVSKPQELERFREKLKIDNASVFEHQSPGSDSDAAASAVWLVDYNRATDAR